MLTLVLTNHTGLPHGPTSNSSGQSSPIHRENPSTAPLTSRALSARGYHPIPGPPELTGTLGQTRPYSPVPSKLMDCIALMSIHVGFAIYLSTLLVIQSTQCLASELTKITRMGCHPLWLALDLDLVICCGGSPNPPGS